MEDKKAYIFGAIFLFSSKLQKLGDELFKEITMKQWLLIIAIVKSGIKEPSLTEVSNVIGYTRQNVKKLSVHLEAKGFVKLYKDEKDNRSLRIALTDKCYEYFKSREKTEDDFIKNLYDGLTYEEINNMFLTMKKLESNIFKLDKKEEKI